MGLVPNAGFCRNQAQGSGHPVLRLQLPDRILAVAVDRARLDAELARDLLGAEMRMHQAQALALAFGQTMGFIHGRSP